MLQFYDLANLAWDCIFTPIWGRGWAYGVILHSNSKKHLVARKHVIWAIKRVCQGRGSTYRENRKKIKTVKKVTKVLYFMYLRKPPPSRYAPKFARRVMFRRLSLVPNFKIKFWGVAIPRGLENAIFLLIFERQCNPTAPPVIITPLVTCSSTTATATTVLTK